MSSENDKKDLANGAGWSHVSGEKPGLPEEKYVRLQPLREEFAELHDFVARMEAVNPNSDEVRMGKFMLERLRRRIWQGTAHIEEQSPEELAKDLQLSAETIRNWCKTEKVKHRRVGTRYIVDVASALEFAGRA